jgi:hypothetical protein
LAGSVAAWLLLGGAAEAATSRPALSCGLYERLNRSCGCNGTDGYLTGFGLRYCNRFLNATGWTPAGARWRDQTLTCLQQALIRKLPRLPNGACDCEKLREAAWQTHVECYTQPSASFCELPLSDIRKIYDIIDLGDLLSHHGASQFFAIAGACMQRPH